MLHHARSSTAAPSGVLLVLAAALCSSPVGALAQQPAARGRPPNVVLVMTDDK